MELKKLGSEGFVGVGQESEGLDKSGREVKVRAGGEMVAM